MSNPTAKNATPQVSSVEAQVESQDSHEPETAHRRPTIAQQIAQLVDGMPRPLTVKSALPLAYQKLRLMARSICRYERRGHTLPPTAVVHEACARLLEGQPEIQDGVHLASLAAQSMRRYLIDHAKARNREKRQRPSPEELHLLTEPACQTETIDVVDIDLALDALAERSGAAADVAQLHYFSGLSNREIAEVLRVSERSVDRSLQFAQAWLTRYIGKQQGAVVEEMADC